MLKRLSRLARISLVASALVAVSASFSIRVPYALINSALGGISPELELVSGDVSYCWGSGQLNASEIIVNFNGSQAISAKIALVNIGLSPHHSTHLLPTYIKVHSAQAVITPQLQKVLEDLQMDNSDLAALDLDIKNVDVQYIDTLNELIELKELTVVGALNGDIGSFEISSKCLRPIVGDLQARLHTSNTNSNWEASVSVRGKLVNDWSVFETADLTFDHGSVEADLDAAGDWQDVDSWRLASDLELKKPLLASPTLSFDQSNINISGSSATGLNINATTNIFGGDVQSIGVLSFDDDASVDLQIEHSIKSVVVNQELRQWLGEIESEIPAFLDATQAAGTVDVQALTSVHNYNLDWAIAIKPNDLDLAYQGFVTAGEAAFSFPYASQFNNGYIAITEGALIFNTLGEHANGAIKINGEVDFLPRTAAIDLSIAINDIALEQEVFDNLSGNPEITDLISDLGSPHGGLANAHMRLFTDGDDNFDYFASIDIFDCVARPKFLPMNVQIEKAHLDITENTTEFKVTATAAKSRLQISGETHNYIDREDLQLIVDVHGSGWHPNSTEAEIMSGNLPIPAGLSSFPIDGDFKYNLEFLWPNMNSDPQLSALLYADGVTVNWPQLGISLDGMATNNAQLYAAGEKFNFHFGEIETKIDDGTIRGCANLSHDSTLNYATVSLKQLPLSNDLILGSQKFANQQTWGEHLGWDGAIDGFVSFNPLQPKLFAGEIIMKPLTINIKGDFEDSYTINGAINLGPNQILADSLKMSSKDSTLMVYNLDSIRLKDRVHIEADLESNRGIELTSDLQVLAGSKFAAILKELGVEGNLKAESLHVSADLHTDRSIDAKFTGGFEISDLRASEGIPLNGGYAMFNIKESSWSSAGEFSASMSITDGNARLGELPVDNIRTTAKEKGEDEGILVIDQNGIRVENLKAGLLGGEVTKASFAFFSDPEVGPPYAINLNIENIDLGQMRNELGIRGALSGRLTAKVDIDSTGTSLIDCTGDVHLEVKDAMLGSVPVLKSIWQVSGLPTPAIDNGHLKLTLGGNGKMSVESISLDGAAFEFIGKGTATMDAMINLKITMRTFSFITRLPLVKDILDFFIEQQVYGPIEDLKIRHRSWSKIIEWITDDEAFVPPAFPLWVPTPALPEWNTSPIIPVQ
jgi:hypothetical protein